MPRPRIDRSKLIPAVRRSASVSGEIVPLREGQNTRGGVSYEINPSGLIYSLSITMPQDDGPPNEPLKAPAQWRNAPKLAVPFAEALFISMIGNSPRTFRRAFYQTVSFFDFLEQDGCSTIGLNGLSTEIVERYLVYLTVNFASPTTRRGYYGSLKAIVATLRTLPAYAHLLTTHLKLRSNPWEGSSKTANKRLGIPIVELFGIERACVREIKSVLASIEKGDALTRDCTDLSLDSIGESTTLAQTLSLIKSAMNGYVPSLAAAYDFSPALVNGIRDAGGIVEIWKHLHLTGRTLMPFLVLFCIRTAFNSETCVTISKYCVKESPLIVDSAEVEGQDKRHGVVGKKSRARIIQRRTFLASDMNIDNPVILVRMVLELTAAIRPHVNHHFLDRLFIYPTSGIHSVRGFDLKGGTYLSLNLKSFIADNDLFPFTLAKIRPTISELIDILTHGDLVARQKILGHQNESTTEMHYTSAGSKERRKERLGEYQNQRERWTATGGKSDPRQSDMGGTKRAATGGFECVDPYDSPVIGEMPGRLCQAWGNCPACPMAGINPKDAYGLARVIQLEASIEAARHTVSASRWMGHWLPLLHSIRTVWLPMYTDSAVWKEAENIRLGPLEIVE